MKYRLQSPRCLALIATAALGCVPDTDATLDDEFMRDAEVIGIDALAPWPTIHHDLAATNASPVCGPSSDLSATQPRTLDTGATIVTLHAGDLIYAQAMGGAGELLAYDATTLSLAHSFPLGASYPNAGGGLLDDQGYSWWTADSKLVRLSHDLSEATWSTAIPAGAYNGTTLLPDGNMLVTGMPLYSVIATEPVDGELEVRHSASLGDLDFGGPNPTLDAGFGPRPLTDGLGHFFFVIDAAIFRVSYDPVSLELAGATQHSPDWIYEAPAGLSFGDSIGVLTDGRLCVHAAPEPGVAGSQVLCLDQQSGALVGSATAFPQSTKLLSTWHNIAVAENGYVIAINDSFDGSGGAVAFAPWELEDGEMATKWTVNLANIGHDPIVADLSGLLYLSSRKSLLAPYVVNAIDVDTGARSTIYQSRDIGGMPGKSLSFLGLAGALFMATPDGPIELVDPSVPSLCP
ncbi:PQQ-like beta-propeller repeat protein [Pseudenhygromyxa sp. WMMC2535]|uniref:PQQ-like beta-propeller repeat protein n=1 Tax=Pseudenhygromyxa sp. WMMC2535 TaxID=2712867 RepID=UPI001553DDD3|nr:PQQ-like beta-propeller repeat protein [Pseudenhygromyxa sp. WMMC2535]NVB43110.1 PQQ-like beta-propeller repeat protein [Pseudenhygromyxa sp. WMMC2535]